MGDIIPPYDYIDEDGSKGVSDGLNWDTAGQAIWQLGCQPGLEPLRPIVECVEVGENGAFLAHFGYENPNDKVVSNPPENIFKPLDANGQQPTSFQPGLHKDAFQVGSKSGEDLTWNLTGNKATATSGSPRCQGSITIVKVLNPGSDKGRFALELDLRPVEGATAVGDGGSTGTIAVDTGDHTVGESGANGTNLSLYDIQISCASGSGVVAEGSSAKLTVPVMLRQAVVCTIRTPSRQQRSSSPRCWNAWFSAAQSPTSPSRGTRTRRASRSSSSPGVATALTHRRSSAASRANSSPACTSARFRRRSKGPPR